jgi:pilus assembly protein FimV
MGRKINAAIFGSSFLIPGIAGAFGLGDITLNSALNQPLDAKIVITQVGDLSPAEIIGKLAPAEAFEKSGVTRDQFLNEIRFRVEVGNNGNATIHLSTRKPVVEPFLNFIVEVQWPQGKLLREYTLLLDPPVFAQESYQPIEHALAPAPRPNASDVSRVSEQRNQNAMPVTGYTEKTPSPTVSPAAPPANTYGPVARSESLWGIAQKLRPSNAVTIHQTMLALQEMNPQAFVQNNINLLKEGAVLRVPKADEVQQKDTRAAIEEVNQQNKAWENTKTKMPKSNGNEAAVESQMGDSVEPLPEKNVGDSGHLKLVTPIEENAPSTGTLGSNENKTSTAAVDATVSALEKENLAKIALENEELKSRLNDVSMQVKTSEDLVKLKDEQIASLQQKLNELENKAQAQPAAAADNSSPDNWLNNPTIVASMAAAVVLILVGFMLVRRNKKNADESNELDLPAYALHVNKDSGEKLKEQQHSLAPENEFELDEPAAVHEEKVKQELGDVIGEAEIYIAYGRFSHAVELLKQGCNSEPGRDDIRLKYLEVLAEMGDKEEFKQQESILRKTADSKTLDTIRTLHHKLFGTEISFDENEGTNSLGANTERTEFNAEQSLVRDEVLEEASADQENGHKALDLSTETYDSNFSNNNTSEVALSDSADTQSMNEGDYLTEHSPIDTGPESLEFDLNEDENTSEYHQNLRETPDVMHGIDEAENKRDVNDAEFDFDLEGESSALSTVAFESSVDDINAQHKGVFSNDVNESLDTKEGATLVNNEADNEFEFDFSLDDTSDTHEIELPHSELTMDFPESTVNEINLDEDDLDLLADLDEAATKLDLARAYLEMGDAAGARDILNEVISEGNEDQKQDAKELLKQIA